MRRIGWFKLIVISIFTCGLLMIFLNMEKNNFNHDLTMAEARAEVAERTAMIKMFHRIQVEIIELNTYQSYLIFNELKWK